MGRDGGEMQMRKHIGTKIISMLALLVVLYVVTIIVSDYSGQRSISGLKMVGNNYLALQRECTALTKATEECKLYGNLIVMMDDAQTAENIAHSMSDVIGEIDASVTEMDALVAACNDAELASLLDAYKAELETLKDSMASRRRSRRSIWRAIRRGLQRPATVSTRSLRRCRI